MGSVGLSHVGSCNPLNSPPYTYKWYDFKFEVISSTEFNKRKFQGYKKGGKFSIAYGDMVRAYWVVMLDTLFPRDLNKELEQRDLI